MWNKRILPAITIAALLIGFLISLQFQTHKKATRAEQLQNDRMAQARTVVDQLKERNQDLQSEYKTLTAEIEKLSTKEQNSGAAVTQLDQYKKMDGTEAVKGPGIKMTILDSGPDVKVLAPILPEDLKKIVNTLRLAGAEAIAINGQRIVGTTSIVSSGPSNIVINQVPISKIRGSSYEVLAIGDPGNLTDYLDKMIAQALKEDGIKVDIIKNQSITIPSYKRGYEFKLSQRLDG
ncbi:DUF881 domain-containing protein [Syntrophobotulus glycolicus]|nr:DUF881 domain-containing protein [Syntrophobotulus glycolicus]